MQYLVLYDTTEHVILNAVDIKDCVLLFADYHGDKSRLFELALKGCEKTKDIVEMCNNFSSYIINNIYVLGKEEYKMGDG